MSKSEIFTKFYIGKKIAFDRIADTNKNPNPVYTIHIIDDEENSIQFRMKKDDNGRWGMEDRSSLPTWVNNLQIQLAKAITENELAHHLGQATL